jgi:tellurite resistance protein
MAKDIFRERGQADEAAYFHQRDAMLIEKIRAKAKLSEIAQALAEKLHVENPELLRRITDLGVTLETGAAFLSAPLVQVAWADHRVTPEEHALVLRFAHERGIDPGSAAEAQLIKWLEGRPPDALFDAAIEAIAAGLTVLPPDEADARIDAVMRACRTIAEAPEGIGRVLQEHSLVTPAERHTLDLIRASLRAGRRRPDGEGPTH